MNREVTMDILIDAGVGIPNYFLADRSMIGMVEWWNVLSFCICSI